MLLGLSHNAIRDSYYQHGRIGLAGSGDHVLYEVSVTGAVHYGKVELCGIEAVMGDIDGDAPLTLFLQAIHDPGELEGCLSLGCCFFPVLINDVSIYCSRLEHQSAYSGRLTMVDVSNEC